MLDLSDGLGGDAGHLAAASGLSLTIDLDQLPLQEDVAGAAARAGVPAAEFGALGGEDYELLATLPPEFGPAQAERVVAATGVPLTRIGVAGAGAGVRFLLGGREVPLRGYDHFR
jgi:thiamine-monophosphate kinase